MSFSYTDQSSKDNTAFLSAVAIDEQITCNGVTWTVTAITPRGSNVLFTVAPAVTAPPYGISDFYFGAPPGDSVTIAAGEALSSALDITGKTVAMIIAPPDWTPANITFQISMDNVAFHDLYDVWGNEVLRAIRPGTAMMTDPSVTQYVNFIKIRSGPHTNPVKQQDHRMITLVLV